MGSERIVLVVWRLSVHGGIPVLVRSLAKGMVERGKDVHIVSLRPRFAEDHLEELEPSVTFHFLGMQTPAGKWSQLMAPLRLRRLIQSLHPDIVHVQSGTAWYSVLISGRSRRMLEVQDSPQIGRTSAINHRVTRWMAHHGWSAFVHSERVATDVAVAYGLPKVSIETFALGIGSRFSEPVSDERIAAVRSNLNIDEGREIVSWVGRMTEAKAPDVATEIIKMVTNPNVVLVMAGSGNMVEKVRRTAPKNVVVAGPVDDLEALYQTSSAFLSTSEYEGFGLAIVEAQMAGLPVVALEGGAVRERFLYPEGSVFQRTDLGAAAAAIDKVMGAGQVPTSAISQTEWTRANLTLAAMVDSFLAVYEVPTNGSAES